MRVANALPPQTSALTSAKAPAAPAPAVDSAPAEPTETFGTRFKHEVGATLVSGANDWKLGVGGAAGIAGATLGTYAGVIGGAVLGSLAGAGVGPMVASIGSHGVLSSLGTVLATTNGGAGIGMILGAGTGMMGGFALGKAAAGVPAMAANALGKSLLGYDPNPKEADGPTVGLKSKTIQVLGTTLIGVAGAAPGLAGGAILGGGVAAAGSLFTGLLAHNVTMASLTTTGAAGAAVGGAIGITMGVMGGISALNWIRHRTGETIEKQQQAVQWLQLDDKDKRLTASGKTLDTLQGNLGHNNSVAGQEHTNRIADLDKRDGEIIVDNKRIDYKNAHEAELVEKRATQLYDQTKAALVTREQGENDRQVTLDSEDKRVDGKRADITHLIDVAQNKLYDDLHAKLESQYQTRKGQLESRDNDLHQREANIPNVVNQRVQATLNPLRSELQNHINNANSYDSQAAQLHSQAQSDTASIPGILAEARSEQSAAQGLQGQISSLQSQQNPLNSQVQNMRQQNELKKEELDRREQALNAQGK